MERIPSRPPPPPGLSLGLGDIYYILFRHKWKIVILSSLGFIIALLLPLVWKLPYQSEAKLFIRYVTDSRSPGQMAGNDSKLKSPDERGENIINSELEILTSLDLAGQVVDAVGVEKILGKGAGPADRNRAAAMVHRNLIPEVPKKSNVIRIIFQHSNPEIVQPVLEQVVAGYLRQHAVVHQVGVFDEFLNKQTDQLRSGLAQTEEMLRSAISDAHVFSVEGSRKGFIEQNSKIQQAIFDAEAELAERQAAAGELAKMLHTSLPVTSSSTLSATNGTKTDSTNAGAVLTAKTDTNAPVVAASTTDATNALAVTTNQLNTPVPSDKIAEYRRLTTKLEGLQKHEQDLLFQFVPGSAMVKPIEDQIADAEKQRQQMEEENPGLLALPVAQSKTSETTGTPRLDLSSELAKIISLQAKIRVLTSQLENIRTNAATLDMAEGKITELQRKKDFDEVRYRSFAASLEQSRIDEALGPNRISNIQEIQKPSAPFQDGTKLQKIRAMAFLGSIAAALALVFLVELYVDRTLKRPTEIEPKLGLPLFITIPLFLPNGKHKLLNGRSKRKLLLNGKSASPVSPEDNGVGHTNGVDQNQEFSVTDTGENPASTPIAPPVELVNGAPPNLPHLLRPFSEALRDRLITFFELKNLTHKPKLVSVTSCGEGSGVTTVAAGLAAALSETGDGNVLLVDMNNQHGAAHHFHRGTLECSLEEALETGTKRDGAMVQDNLYVVSEATNGDNLPRVLPKRFNNLVPRLKTSDYDYIIFDMPPVSQISVTSRLARFMDMVLLVVESEKSDRDVVKRGLALLSETKPNMGIVLNKRRTYVPKSLVQEL